MSTVDDISGKVNTVDDIAGKVNTVDDITGKVNTVEDVGDASVLYYRDNQTYRSSFIYRGGFA